MEERKRVSDIDDSPITYEEMLVRTKKLVEVIHAREALKRVALENERAAV